MEIKTNTHLFVGTIGISFMKTFLDWCATSRRGKERALGKEGKCWKRKNPIFLFLFLFLLLCLTREEGLRELKQALHVDR